MSAPEDNRVDEFRQQGWIKFPFRFSEDGLSKLERQCSSDSVGKRLSDMRAIAEKLPKDFKTVMENFGFSSSPIRAVWFRKDTSQNWSLPWHQDRIITKAVKTDDPKLKNWTKKNGQWHCEPEVDHLKRLAFLHIAFDPMTAQSGQLQLLEKSHLRGKIRQADITGLINQLPIAAPDLCRGEAIFVSSLLLHKSSSNQSNHPRRALRLDFELS